MLKSLLLFCCLGCWAAAASAQPARDPAQPAQALASEPAREEAAQQRRAGVRATVKAQQNGAPQDESKPVAARQLTPQERAELRQQVRQYLSQNP